MATTLIRKQIAVTAVTATTLYTVPAATQTVTSSVIVCNRGAVLSTFRVALRALGVATTNDSYLYYDVTIAPNDTFVATIGIVLIATDILEVYASTSNLTFQMAGQENT